MAKQMNGWIKKRHNILLQASARPSGSGYNKIENEYIFQISISNLQISAYML
jgi:hypothetical protein